MSKARNSPIRFAWRSTCHSCKALFQWFYSVFVLLLISATVFAAYVATLDDIPVPNFIIREVQSQLRNKGIDLRMAEVRFQPNGRIIFIQPEFHSPELGSTVVAADSAVAKLKLSHLAFGNIAVDEVRLSSGRFVIPAMLTPSGEPTTAISSIDFEATHRGQRWNIAYANLAIDDLKLSLSGQLDDRFIKLPAPKPDAPKPSITQAILKIAPKVTQLQKELKRLDAPFCTIDLAVLNKQQSATIQAGARRLTISPEIQIQDLQLQARYTLGSTLAANLQARKVELPQDTTAQNIHLNAKWNNKAPPEQLLPNSIHVSATEISNRGIVIPSVVVNAQPGETQHRATLQFALPSSPIVARVVYDIPSKTSAVDLSAQLDSATLEAVNPIALELAKRNITDLASLTGTVDAHATAQLDEKFQPVHVEAHAQAGPASIHGANIDYASAHATMAGPQIDLDEIRLQSGKQQGVITIGYNLETMLRRILVEGSFDPTMINLWFGPWWTAMWDGMVFPERGMLTYLDSQGIFKRPDTIRVTGTGYVRDIDLRGMPVEELRTRIFSLFHYVDLYDIELATKDGQQAQGQVQFHMDRDTRDDKDKLTGIWIQALSTLDVKNAPNILWEIADATAKILAPYCYDLPPFISARSSSVRHKDAYLNDIDLEIETPTAFTFYGFPFESLDAFVHIDDDVIDIPRAEADLGNGKVKTSGFIIGDTLQIDAQLEQVGFGQALNATNTYFANDGSETAQAMDTERLLNFGGKIDAQFQGEGFLGDPLSYVGSGDFNISKADFGSFRMLGLLSMALEITPLRFTTLKFTDASAPFTVDHNTVNFTKGKVEGPVAAIETEGLYNIETDAVHFTAHLFPFQNSKVPLISPLINIPLSIFSNALEVSVTGTFDQPQLRLFNPNTKQKIDVASPRPNRDHRPPRR